MIRILFTGLKVYYYSEIQHYSLANPEVDNTAGYL